MAFTKRGLRLVKALEKYPKEKHVYFDTINIFSKIKFTAAADGYLKATMTVDRSMCNGMEMMHGGYIALVLDIMAIYGNLGKINGKMAVTSNIYINYISPASIGEKLIAEAKSVKGGANSIMESFIHKENGDLVAKGMVCLKNLNDQFQRESSKVLGFDILKTDE